MQMLQNVVRQETAFVICVKDVITKSSQKVAFEAIYDAYKQLRRADKVKRNISIMFTRLTKRVF